MEFVNARNEWKMPIKPPLKNPYIRPCGKTGFDHVSKNTILKEKSWNRSNTSLQ